MSYYSRIEMTIKGNDFRNVAKRLVTDRDYLEAHEFDYDEEIPYADLFLDKECLFENYVLDELAEELKHLRKNAKEIRFKLYDECNHFDYFMSNCWLRELKRYSTQFPETVFIIHQKNEEDEYYEWQIQNGKAMKRAMIVVLKGREWEEI